MNPILIPPGKSMAGRRWVYVIKVGPNAQVDRIKAQMVAKGSLIRGRTLT